jgi:hypothetical protein
MRFNNAMTLADIANTNSAHSASHQMNESPRNHLSNAVRSRQPRPTLMLTMAMSCQKVDVVEGMGVMPGMLHVKARNGRDSALVGSSGGQTVKTAL